MQKLFAAAKELFFPRKCFFCSKYGDLICADCAALLDVSPVHRPDRGKKYLADIYSACSYENRRAQKIIHALKYDPFVRELARPMAQIIAGHFALCGQDPKDCFLAAVPLARKRLRERGFNQAQALAEELAKIWRIPIAGRCLEKTRETRRQAELSQSERRNNLRGAFVCPDAASIKNKNIVLVDDVVTTGATMEECAKILRGGGATEVTGICFARTER